MSTGQRSLIVSSSDGPKVRTDSPPTSKKSSRQSCTYDAPSPMKPGITFDNENRVFRLRGRNSTYAFHIDGEKNLEHLYWGKALPPEDEILYLANSHNPGPYSFPGSISAEAFARNQTSSLQQVTSLESPLASDFAHARFMCASSGRASTNTNPNLTPTIGKTAKLLEYSDAGTGDYREPSFRVLIAKNGSSICPLQYENHVIIPGKPEIQGSLPAVYTDTDDEATTLIIDMVNPATLFKIQLYYTVLHGYDIITRRAVAINQGASAVDVHCIASATVDFDAQFRHYLTQFSGAWARERHMETFQVRQGVSTVKSTTCSSSHQLNPFVVITPDSEPSETQNECFGFCLIYSGNFAITAEVTDRRRLRMNVGVNPDTFLWTIDPAGGPGDKTFATPEVIMSYSEEGLGKLSRQNHRLIREHLLPKRWRYKVPPVLLNVWEAVYFDIRHDDIVDIARSAAAAGIELLVVDDGWFKNRNSTARAVGDWTPDLKKLPFGLSGLGRALNKIGLKLGLWLEPEMVSPDSDLFRAHPDWCLGDPIQPRTTGRNQLLLNMASPDVVNHVVEVIGNLLTSANIEYIKWDMNRYAAEMYSELLPRHQQGRIAHAYTLGLYTCLRRLTTRFPNILFEMCCGGGGRFDAGMMAFSPQIWTSDNTDAISRMKIQYGTSLAYPMSVMGAHVSAVPNHQTRRITTMKTRSFLAMAGTFGFEMDARAWSSADVKEIRGYIQARKRIAPIVYEGDLHRLWSPFASDSCAWMFVSRDASKAVVMAFCVKKDCETLHPRLKLRGLQEDVVYSVEELYPGTTSINIENGAIVTEPAGVYQIGGIMNIMGQTLHNAGIPVKFLFDGDCVCYELTAINKAKCCETRVSA